MRGLAVFISDIRNCKSKEAEIQRINKELANIRSKFKGDKTLDGYNKKKYVCKLLFMFLLGHDIDFGHIEAVSLTTSNRYSEKQIGYLFISILISSDSELIKLIIQNMKNDLNSTKAIFVNLALHCIANFSSIEMVEAFSESIPKLLLSGHTTDNIKQSAALCFLRLFRTAPDLIAHDALAPRLIHLLNDHHLGVLTSAVSLIHALSQHNPQSYKDCVPFAISRLNKIVTALYSDLQDYTYYFVPAPWLTVKLLRLLQCFSLPDDPVIKQRLIECLDIVLSRCQEPPKSKKIQHSNAKHAILMEGIHLIIHIESEHDLLVRACNQLSLFLTHRETNLRYLSLEAMCLLARSEMSLDVLLAHQPTIINSLHMERDVSVRKRAMDLLYAMCDKSNVEEIVGNMLTYLKKSDYSIREELVLKIAILSERYASDYSWYVDTILALIETAGDYVSDEVWHRVIQIVVNRSDVQLYAAKTVYHDLCAASCHENMVKVGAYILGEFGNLISDNEESSPTKQFHLLHSKYFSCSPLTRAMLLSTYVKFINVFPNIKDEILKVLQSENLSRSSDVEVQQRAVEYVHLSSLGTSGVLKSILEEMPPFPERESSILAKLREKNTTASRLMLREEEQVNKHVSHGPQRTSQQSHHSHEVEKSSSLNTLETEKKLPTTNPVLIDFDQPNAPPDPLIDAQPQAAIASAFTAPPETTPLLEAQFLSKFLFENSGILYEDNFLQIGVKLEFRDEFGRLCLLLGNKSNLQLRQFSVAVQQTPESLEALNMDAANEVPTFLDGGAHAQYNLTCHCLSIYKDLPQLCVQFVHSTEAYTVRAKLPVLMNKFFQPVEMTLQNFSDKWNQLAQKDSESQKIFPAKKEIDVESNRIKIAGFGLSCLLDIDPNPNNVVGTGILKTKMRPIGCLLRLQPNMQNHMYCLTIRSSFAGLSPILCELLQEQF